VKEFNVKQVLYFIVTALWLVSCSVLAATKETLLDEATQLNKTASNYYQQGNYPQALEALLTSLTIREKLLGKQHPDIATDYNHIGATYLATGNYPKALEYQQKALKIRKKVLGKQDLDTAASYNNIGEIYRAIGNYPKALQYQQKALTIQDKFLGKQHPTTATSYNNIGATYRALGAYPKALTYHEKALTIREKVFGQQHPLTATSYNNIGLTYGDMGNHFKALEYNLKALKIREKVLGKQADAVISDQSKVLKDELKALAILENALGKQHPATAGSYHNIGVTYGDMGYYPRALEYLSKALAIRETISDQHPQLARSYNSIALIYKAMGTDTGYTKSVEYQLKAKAVDKKRSSNQQSSPVKNDVNLGETYHAMDKHAKAYHYAQEDFVAFLQDRENNFAALGTSQKKQYLSLNEEQINRLLSYANTYQQSLLNNKKLQKNTHVTQETLNNWLTYKGSILESENRLILFAKTSKDPDIKKKYDQLVILKKSYSALNQNYPKIEKKQETWRQKLKQYEAQITTLERSITQADPRFKDEKALQAITSKTIAKGLKATELYIDYGKTREGYYLFTIDHDNRSSFTAFSTEDSVAINQQLVLFSDNIESMISNNKVQHDLKIKSPANLKAQNDIKTKAQIHLSKLYNLLIPSTLQDKIASKDSLIISPDAALRLLPFEALYDQDNTQYLIQQKDIRYIASGKELVRLFRQQQQSQPSNNDKAVLFANPDFDNRNTAKNRQRQVAVYKRHTNKKSVPRILNDSIFPNVSNKKSVKNNQRQIASYTDRKNTLRSLRNSAFSFTPLPATKIEAENIIKMLKPSHVRYYYSGHNASEANLLSIQQPAILHIATHGFFDEDKANPMLQSGLILAGANTSLKQDSGEGIVTALDLAGLDLNGTELVVLSACDTGKIDPNNTSGVSGLTKAFIQAGAKNVVMSLWQVADKETADLMQGFYKASRDNNGQYANALKHSKLAMIEEGFHPYYWSAFVLSGL